MRQSWKKNKYRIFFVVNFIILLAAVWYVVTNFSYSSIIVFSSYFTIVVFLHGSFRHLRNIASIKKYVKMLKKRVYSMHDVVGVAHLKGRKDIPKLAVFVPARNEGRVIENTIRRLTELDYPSDAYKIYVIVDERELKDNVDRFTKTVAQETILSLQKDYPAGFVNCVEVPEWYSGRLGDFSQTYAHSTKGRALNYCLEYLRYTGDDEDIEMIGILDADGRLDVDSLKEIAHTRMMKESKILQGIVLGVSNLKNVNIIGLAAFLEQTLHHLTYMTRRMLTKGKKQLFLAGTNYFVEKELIYELGGWDPESLVEDAELGLRTYLKTGHTADWYSCPEIEQSPNNFSTYFKQRERWARGHFQLIPYVAESKLPLHRKAYYLAKLYANAYDSIWHLGVPMIGFFLLAIGAYGFLGVGFQFLMLYLLFASLTILDLYGLIYRSLQEYIEPHIDEKMTRWNMIKTSALLYIYTPLHFFVQSMPRIYAPFKYYSSPHTAQVWYKTERTEEVSEEKNYLPVKKLEKQAVASYQ